MICGAACAKPQTDPAFGKPNVILISADDLGYGDLGCFGSQLIRTPVLDQLAEEGQQWTHFYSASSVCTPSRAALLTGRLPMRSGMHESNQRVLDPQSLGGLPDTEWTIAKAMRSVGYQTACIGKWHLGHQSEFLPTNHGFDAYFGVPYSNDMNLVPDAPRGVERYLNPQSRYWDVPLMFNDRIIERPADQSTLATRYTDAAVHFINANAGQPFFLYLAYSNPHVPLFPSPAFLGKSAGGRYGDVVEELDASIGRVVEAVRARGLTGKTVIVFTSDNGPWNSLPVHFGSTGGLRGGKGDTFEGGLRVPTICWGPGMIAPGLVEDLGSHLDLLPTLCTLAGATLPDNTVIDGLDLSGTWLWQDPSPRKSTLYYRGTDLYATRSGNHKAHFITKTGYGADPAVTHAIPLLIDLENDPAEQMDVAGTAPEALRDVLIETARRTTNITIAPSQLDRR